MNCHQGRVRGRSKESQLPVLNGTLAIPPGSAPRDTAEICASNTTRNACVGAVGKRLHLEHGRSAFCPDQTPRTRKSRHLSKKEGDEGQHQAERKQVQGEWEVGV